MAIDFGCKVLGQLGVLDEDGPTPKPLNINMAKAGLLKLVETIHQQIGQHRIAVELSGRSGCSACYRNDGHQLVACTKYCTNC